MAQAILRAAVKRQGIAQVKTHGLAPAGNGGMKGTASVGGDAAHMGSNKVSCGPVILRAANVLHGLALGISHHVNVAAVKLYARHVVVRAELVEPAHVVTQQRQLGSAGTLCAGDQVHLGWDEGRMFVGRQGVQRLGDDLRGQAAHC